MRDHARDAHGPLARIRRVHFIGIGGSGMCGIAELMYHMGYHITGSDANPSPQTRRLVALGVDVAIGHQTHAARGADLVVYSPAVPDTNLELAYARTVATVIPRAEMLSGLMRLYNGIAVAGTHGKTTTTGMVSHLLSHGGMPTTSVVGGLLAGLGKGRALVRHGWMVAEADESDGTFESLAPDITIVTNLDADHLEKFDGDMKKLIAHFEAFLHRLPFFGYAVVGTDSAVLRQMAARVPRKVVTYGAHPDADVRVTDIELKQDGATFVTHGIFGGGPTEVSTPLRGQHMVLNAVAALTIASIEGVERDAALSALMSFEGVHRRMEVRGETTALGVKTLVVDDYGHHPTELEATFAAVRASWPERRLVVVFQPHRYSRTSFHLDAFASTLASVDELVLLDVYPAGESIHQGGTTEDLCRVIREQRQVTPVFPKTLSRVMDALKAIVKEDDVILIQGAGDVSNLASSLMSPSQ